MEQWGLRVEDPDGSDVELCSSDEEFADEELCSSDEEWLRGPGFVAALGLSCGWPQDRKTEKTQRRAASDYQAGRGCCTLAAREAPLSHPRVQRSYALHPPGVCDRLGCILPTLADFCAAFHGSNEVRREA